MKLLRASLLAVGLPLLVIVTFASAQGTDTPSCKDADASNARVKESCTGQVTQRYDDHKCLWMKCGDTQPSTATVSSSSKSISEETCHDEKSNNSRIESTCHGHILSITDNRGCLLETCQNSSSSLDTAAYVAKACEDLRAQMAKSPNSSEYDQWKKSFLVHCTLDSEQGSSQSSFSTMSSSSAAVSMQCHKIGCDVKCDDGTSYNVCKAQVCIAPHTSTAPECKTSKDADGCWITECGTKRLRSCPSKSASSISSVRCETKKIDNCLVKTCSNGSTQKSCTK